MDEYRKTAPLLFVPSLIILIFSIAAILLAYGAAFSSAGEMLAGALILILGLPVSLLVSRHSAVRESGPSAADVPAITRGAARATGYTLASIRPFLLPVLFFLFTGLHVSSLMKDSSIGGEEFFLYGVVEEVRSLRNSNEVLFRVYEREGDIDAGREGVPAAGYSPLKTVLAAGDIVEIAGRPGKIIMGEERNLFEKGFLRKGCRHLFSLRNGDIRVIRPSSPSMKERLRAGIEGNLRSLFSPRSIPLLKGLYFGNTSYIDRKTLFEFRKAGVLHILAASGTHVGIVASLPLLLLGMLRADRRMVLLATVVLLSLYLFITDQPVSLMRAFLMFLIYSLQKFFDMDRNICNALFLSASVLLLAAPWDLYDLGFQLSFGATLGILLFMNLYRMSLSWLPSFIGRSLSLTMAALVFVLPLIFLHMKEINLTGIVSNILIVPGMDLVLLLSLLANLLSLVSTEAAFWAAIVTDRLLQANLVLVGFLSRFPGHYLIEDPGRAAMLLLPFCLSLFPLLPRIRRRQILSLPLLAGLAAGWLYLSAAGDIEEKQILVCRDEATDLILCKTGARAVIYGSLRDARDTGELLRYIEKNGISDIHLCLPVADHANLKNFGALIRKSMVTRCSLTSRFRGHPSLAGFFELLDREGVTLEIRDFLHPSPSAGKGNPLKSGQLDSLLMSAADNIERIHAFVSRPERGEEYKKFLSANARNISIIYMR